MKVQTGQAWQNGLERESVKTKFLEIPDVALATIEQNEAAVGLLWRWQGGPTFRILEPELPGPESYLLTLTWKASEGVFDVYVNGTPISTLGETYEPWEIAETVDVAHTFGPPANVVTVRLTDEYSDRDAVLATIPPARRGRFADTFGLGPQPAPIDLTGRLGRRLADVPLASAADTRDWVMEGPGEVDFRDGWMHMRSTRPDATSPVNGHTVFWCPRDFPDSFVCDWEIQLLEKDGLTIVFFAATGEHGEDLFDAALPPRDGTFSHYTRGAATSYHISYYANTPTVPGRANSNLRKNNHFLLVDSGPVAIGAGSKAIHRMRLIKDGPHIQLQVDGRVSIDYTDPGGDRYGPVLGGGKIGLRQMQWTVARYRNFQVRELNEE